MIDTTRSAADGLPADPVVVGAEVAATIEAVFGALAAWLGRRRP